MAKVLRNPTSACLSTGQVAPATGVCECARMGQHWGSVV